MEDNYKNNMVFGIHPVLELTRAQKEIEKVYMFFNLLFIVLNIFDNAHLIRKRMSFCYAVCFADKFTFHRINFYVR